MNKEFMQRAIALSEIGSKEGKGGPFGCVVVKDGKIVGEGHNQVTSTNDPTAHAEVVAIRNACLNLKTFQLEGCEIYTSCEPCPMCLGAIYWARPQVVYFANTKADAAAIGFDDYFIYQELETEHSQRKIPFIQMEREAAQQAFLFWSQNDNKVNY